jgi:hypothetical protein
MSITLNLPSEIETALIERARVQGVDIDTYLQMLLEQTDTKPMDGSPPAAPLQDAAGTQDDAGAEKARFRAGIRELVQQARELDALHSPKEQLDAEPDPYMQALEEKFRKQGFLLR